MPAIPATVAANLSAGLFQEQAQQQPPAVDKEKKKRNRTVITGPVPIPPLPDVIKLRPTQLRILYLLAEDDGPLSGRAIESMLDRRWPKIVHAKHQDTIGSHDPQARAIAEGMRKRYPTLLSLGYISTDQLDVDGFMEREYEITNKGREALRKHADSEHLVLPTS